MEKTLSLMEFSKKYEEKSSCENLLMEIKVKNDSGIFCPYCGTENPYILSLKMGDKVFKCRANKCYKKFTVKTNSIFEHSKIPINKWLMYVYYQALNKKNVSSIQMSKNLGLTQKTVWQMGDKLRCVLYPDKNIKLKGIVEVDEAFLSKGGTKWTRWGGISTRKEPIIGMIERGGGKLIIEGIPDRKRETILILINKYIEKGSTIYTDGAPIYKSLSFNGYNHESVEHSTREYVRGDVHTNNIEGTWRMLKSNIRHAHHQVSQKHVQRYCDELVYRRNTKELTVQERFEDMLSRCLNFGVIPNYLATEI